VNVDLHSAILSAETEGFLRQPLGKSATPVSLIDGVIPAEAGIQSLSALTANLDARLRGHDDLV